MALWKIFVEEPGDYSESGIRSSYWVDTGKTYEDGFAADLSGWGDEESNNIVSEQARLQEEDPLHRSYAFRAANT